MKTTIDDIYATIANNTELNDTDKGIMIDMIQEFLYVTGKVVDDE